MIPVSPEQALELVRVSERGGRVVDYLSMSLAAWGCEEGGPLPAGATIPLSERQAADFLMSLEWGNPPAARYLSDALEARGWRFDPARYDWVGPEVVAEAEPATF